MTRLRLCSLQCAAALLLFVAACKDDPTSSDDFTVSLSVSNFKRLEAGHGHYELWVSFPEDRASKTLAKPGHGDEAYISFGKFNLSADHTQVLSLSGQAMSFMPHDEVDINLAVDALVTIELEGDQDEEPGARLLAGEFAGSDREASANLSADSEDVFDYDYRAATASYVLAAPTTNDSADFNRGIWWIMRSSAIIAGISKLPALADTARWRYEGWVIDRANAAAYSTGKFLAAANADSDRGGATAGPDGPDQNADGLGDGYAFPGQDFVRASNAVPASPSLDNGNFEARITLEPHPDNAVAPFFLAVFVDEIIGPNLPNDRASQDMNNRAGVSFPTAKVTITR